MKEAVEALTCKKQQKQMLKIIITLIIILAALIGMAKVMGRIDSQREQSALAYESCVSAQYGTTPAAWYADHGVYPVCESNHVSQ